MAIEFDEYGYLFSPIVCKGNGKALNHSFGKIFKNGIVATGFVDDNENGFTVDLEVTAGEDAVTIAPGMVIINGRYGILENEVTLSIDPPDSVARMDYVIARATDSVSGKTVMELDVIRGIPGEVPDEPPIITNDGITSEHVLAYITTQEDETTIITKGAAPFSLKKTAGGTGFSTTTNFVQGDAIGDLARMYEYNGIKSCTFTLDEGLYKCELELPGMFWNAVVHTIIPAEANRAAFKTADVRWGKQDNNGKLTLYATTDPGTINVKIGWFSYL